MELLAELQLALLQTLFFVALVADEREELELGLRAVGAERLLLERHLGHPVLAATFEDARALERRLSFERLHRRVEVTDRHRLRDRRRRRRDRRRRRVFLLLPLAVVDRAAERGDGGERKDGSNDH